MTHIPSPGAGGAVVLLSGGLDSTTLLHAVADTAADGPVFTLAFHYGQRHARELDCARHQAEAAGATEHRVVRLDFLGDLLGGASALVAGGPEVPDLATLSEADRTQPPTYVPNRNMMLLSVAAAYAEARGARDVYYGAQALDEYGYWDCTAGFVEQMNAALALNRREPVRVHAPFLALSKSAILRIGLGLGVDYCQTWSCYRGGEIACGTCPTCVERLKAFADAGLSDPLPYPPLGR